MRRSARAAMLLRAGLLSGLVTAVAVAVAACGTGSGVSAAESGGAGGAAGTANPQAAAQPIAHPHHRGDGSPRVSMLAVRDAFTACEQRIERAADDRVPTMAIVGASYTAGTGPSNPSLSWAADLARNLRWDAVIFGDPGAGYTLAGSDGLGPMTRLLGAERLPSIAPSLVIVQAGYDDGRVPPDVERQQVSHTIELIRKQAPHARIALVTVFTPPGPVPTRFYRLDDTIIAAARSVDPNAIILNPLANRWTYARADHGRGLHPTAAGDAWIARKVGAVLRSNGIDGRPASGSGAAPITCDLRTLASPAKPAARA